MYHKEQGKGAHLGKTKTAEATREQLSRSKGAAAAPASGPAGKEVSEMSDNEKYYYYLERNQQHLNEEEFVGGLPTAQAAAKGSAAARTAQRDAGVV